jgi:hypothetical protein
MARHAGLHDKVRRYIDNLSNFLRSPRLVGKLFRAGHDSPLPL